jgi:hypothetical protein
MSGPTSSWNEIMQYSFLAAFANDNRLDASELSMLERLALRDSEVDDQERLVLSRIFARVSQETTSPDVWREISAFKLKHRIP